MYNGARERRGPMLILILTLILAFLTREDPADRPHIQNIEERAQ